MTGAGGATGCQCAAACLYSRYALAIDGGDIDVVAACFAEDGVYEVDGAYSVQGRDTIAACIRDRRHAGRTHLTANLLLEPGEQEDVLRGRATFAVLAEHAGVIACGEYDDLIGRDADGHWRFLRRRISYRATGPEAGN